MARRPSRRSGYQHRKKAQARQSTHRAVRGLINLANDGIWPAALPLEWVTYEESPGLAAVQAHLCACFEYFEEHRHQRRLDGDVREALPLKHFPTNRDEPNTWLEVHKAVSFAHQVLGHLQEGDRWRNVRRCATCKRWFLARRDPRNPSKPYCGKKCWPSVQYLPSERPRTRVQSRKN